MKLQHAIERAAWVAALMVLPTLAFAQMIDSTLVDDDPYAGVVRYDLSGPRFGVTLVSEGQTRSQFGWHSEHQVAPSSRGPALLVQTVFLVGGFERREFIPSGTLIFGARMPGGFEIGIGPSATIGHNTIHTAVVIAAGHSLKIGGIRVPLNVALSADQDGQRVSLMTGWAVRDYAARR